MTEIKYNNDENTLLSLCVDCLPSQHGCVSAICTPMFQYFVFSLVCQYSAASCSTLYSPQCASTLLLRLAVPCTLPCVPVLCCLLQYFGPPVAYVQQVVVTAAVSPWQPDRLIPNDAFRAPLSLVFDVLPHIHNLQ